MNNINMYYDDAGYYFLREVEVKRVKVPKNCIDLQDVKPSVSYYHYSNPDSQGALICQTLKFPPYFKQSEFELYSAYSDRLAEWDYKHFTKLCELIGTGDGGWAYKLPSKSDKELKQIAKFAFKKTRLPEHVRFIYYYNVSSGYSCPVIVALFKKGKKNESKS